MSNQKLSKELHKLIIGKFEQLELYSSFKDNIQGADLVDIQLTSKYNKGLQFLLCVIDVFKKYGQVIPFKDEKSKTILNGFQKFRCV